MAYTIRLTNGQVLTTIADGTVNDTSSALTLIGKNYSSYGTFLNDNIIHLLENFSNDTPPTTPLTGQLWWDTAGNLNVYTGSRFVNVAAITSSTSEPVGPKTGNQWWDTDKQQFNIYNGSGWTLIGPAFTSNTGTSGTIVGTILDSGNTSHTAVNVYVSNTLIGIISKDADYTPATGITGFTTIKPGFNLVSTSSVSGVAYWGTASDASGLGNVAAANYARTDAAAGSETFDIPVYINNNSGLTVGTANTFAVSVATSTVQLDNKVINADLAIRANIGGTVGNAIAITGSSGAVTIPNVLVVSGNVSSGGYLIATQADNATSTSTGAVRVTGGIGLTKDVYAGGNVTAGGFVNAATIGTSGAVILGSTLSVVGNASVNALTINNSATIGGTLGVTGISTFGANINTTNVVPTTANVSTLGSQSKWFSTVYATAVQSNYADFAERFAADSSYEPGTVVEIGGPEEITMGQLELSDAVFGVISTNPAHLINAMAGTNETHPPVAVNGRVPVKVIGRIRKGDRLVSAGNGYARAGSKEEITPFNVIGRSLETKETDGKGSVLAIVKLNS